ncbi:MAG: winged helix-turn-helix domain-containing protein [Acidimicrobiia bacterium]
MRQIGRDAARRIALGAQGFTQSKPQGTVSSRQFRRVLNALGLIQLDSVNVCVRTHYMPFYSRLGPYDMGKLDTWLNESEENFEYWAHEAAVLPVDRYPLWRWKMDEMQPWRRAQALMDAHPELLGSVLSQVETNGPLTVRDLDAPNHRDEPWWGYGPGKVALEVLFATGQISALRTGNFMRLYDAPERMIPAEALSAPAIPKAEAFRILLEDATRKHGIGTMHDIADYYRLHIPTARPILAELASTGVVEEVDVPGWKGPVYLHPDASRPREVTGATLLSPFDPMVWYRERAERLFDFRYRIEIYVPEPKRVYGYYVLPFLLDGEMVGRVDLKADRKGQRLMVQSSFVEDGQDARRVAPALGAELVQFAQWLGLSEIVVGHKGNLSSHVRPFV